MPTNNKPEQMDIPTLIAAAAQRTARTNPDKMADRVDATIDGIDGAHQSAHKGLVKNFNNNRQRVMQRVVVSPEMKSDGQRRRRNLVDTQPTLKPSRLKAPDIGKKLITNSYDPWQIVEGAPFIYGGSMSPPGIHHKQAFDRVQSLAKSHNSSAYVGVTHPSDQQILEADSRYKVPGDLKTQIWTQIHGVPTDSIVQLRNGFDFAGVSEQLQHEGPIVFAVGAKNINRISPNYHTLVAENLWRLNSNPKHYVTTIPDVVDSNGLAVNASNFRRKLTESVDPNVRWDEMMSYFGQNAGLQPNKPLLDRVSSIYSPVPIKESLEQNQEWHANQIMSRYNSMNMIADKQKRFDAAVQAHLSYHNANQKDIKNAYNLGATNLAMGAASGLASLAGHPAALGVAAAATALGIYNSLVRGPNKENVRSTIHDAAHDTGKRLGVRVSHLFEKVINEDRRSTQSPAERLERSMKMRAGAKRTGTHSKPIDSEKTARRKSKRAARYALRKKLAPNYSDLSSIQKSDIDQQIANHPQLNSMSDEYYEKYRKKDKNTRKPRRR